MATEEQELRTKFSADASGYEAGVNKVNAANEKLYNSGGKVKKGLTGLIEGFAGAGNAADILSTSLNSANKIFKLGIGGAVGAMVASAFIRSTKEANDAVVELQKSFVKLQGLGERNQFKGIGELSSEIKELQEQISKMQEDLHPNTMQGKFMSKYLEINQMIAGLITGHGLNTPGDQESDKNEEIKGLQKQVADRQKAAADIEQRRLGLMQDRIDGKDEEAQRKEREFKQKEDILKTGAGPGGARAQELLSEFFRVSNKREDDALGFRKDEARIRLETGHGKQAELEEASKLFTSKQSEFSGRYGLGSKDPSAEELKLKEEVKSASDKYEKIGLEVTLEQNKLMLTQRSLAINSQNISQEEKKRDLLQAEIRSLKSMADIEESMDSDKAKNDRISAQEKENQLRQDNQELNFGRSALDIQRRIHQEQREQKRRDAFDKRSEANQGLLPFGIHRDISGNIISGRDPITGKRTDGKPERTLSERVTPSILKDKEKGDKAFHDLFNRKMADQHRDNETHRIAAKQKAPSLDPVVKAIQDQTNAWLAALLK